MYTFKKPSYNCVNNGARKIDFGLFDIGTHGENGVSLVEISEMFATQDNLVDRLIDWVAFNLPCACWGLYETPM